MNIRQIIASIESGKHNSVIYSFHSGEAFVDMNLDVNVVSDEMFIANEFIGDLEYHVKRFTAHNTESLDDYDTYIMISRSEYGVLIRNVEIVKAVDSYFSILLGLGVTALATFLLYLYTTTL